MIAGLNDIAQVWWQWMAGMFWQASLFIILITLLDMAIRRWAWPQVRYVLWGLVFIKLIIPPTWQMPTSIVSWIQPKVEEQISIQIAPIEVTAQYQGISVSGLPSTTQISESAVKKERPSWQAIVLLTWVAGMIAFSLILIIKLSRLPKRGKNEDGLNAPEWFHQLLHKMAQRLKLIKTPDVVFSKNMKSPAVYGLFKPILILPEGCLDQLSQEQAEHVLMHELCHLKRGDLLVHWLCLILQVVYWFNPLLIWTRRQMRHVCEICCDLSVANLLRERTRDYRDTLLTTAKELLAETVEPGLGLLGVFEEPFRLVTRLKWLEKKTWENRKQKIAATIITSLIMVVCVMPMAGLSQQAGPNRAEYKNGIEYDQNNGTVVLTYPAVFYEAFFVEVDEDKDLDLSAAEGLGGITPEQIEEMREAQSSSATAQVGPNYAIRAGVYPGEPSEVNEEGTTVQSGDYDIERVEVLFGPQSTMLSSNSPGGIVNIVTDEPKEDGTATAPESEVFFMSGEFTAANMPDNVSLQSPTSKEIFSGAIDSTWSPVDAIRVLKDDIIIGEMNYPDMESAIEDIEYKSVLTRRIPIPVNKMAAINLPVQSGELKQSLEISPHILENGDIHQKIMWRPMEGSSGGFIFKANGVEMKDGSTLVINFPIYKDIKNDEMSENGTKLYLFLTPRIIRTEEDAQDYFETNNMELSTDVFYTDPPSDDYETLVPDPPEWIFGAEYDDAEIME